MLGLLATAVGLVPVGDVGAQADGGPDACGLSQVGVTGTSQPSAAISGDGNVVAFIRAGSLTDPVQGDELVVVDVDTGTELLVVDRDGDATVPVQLSEPRLSADGSRVAVNWLEIADIGAPDAVGDFEVRVFDVVDGSLVGQPITDGQIRSGARGVFSAAGDKVVTADLLQPISFVTDLSSGSVVPVDRSVVAGTNARSTQGRLDAAGEQLVVIVVPFVDLGSVSPIYFPGEFYEVDLNDVGAPLLVDLDVVDVSGDAIGVLYRSANPAGEVGSLRFVDRATDGDQVLSDPNLNRFRDFGPVDDLVLSADSSRMFDLEDDSQFSAGVTTLSAIDIASDSVAATASIFEDGLVGDPFDPFSSAFVPPVVSFSSSDSGARAVVVSGVRNDNDPIEGAAVLLWEVCGFTNYGQGGCVDGADPGLSASVTELPEGFCVISAASYSPSLPYGDLWCAANVTEALDPLGGDPPPQEPGGGLGGGLDGGFGDPLEPIGAGAIAAIVCWPTEAQRDSFVELVVVGGGDEVIWLAQTDSATGLLPAPVQP